MGIEWSHKNPSSKWIGKFTRGRFWEIEKSKDTAASSGDMKAYFFGILPKDSDLYVSTTTNDQAASSPIQATYKMDDVSAFEWVDRIAENTYKNIPPGRAPEVAQQVQLLTGLQSMRNLPVKEISSINDLLKEIHYYCETGPGP